MGEPERQGGLLLLEGVGFFLGVVLARLEGLRFCGLLLLDFLEVQSPLGLFGAVHHHHQ